MKAGMKIGLILYYIIIYSTLEWTVESRNVFVAAPNVFRLGAKENIALVIDGVENTELLEVYVQDYPERRRNFSNAVVALSSGKPEIVTLTMEPEDVEDMNIQDPNTVFHVCLVVHGDGFHKEAIIPLSITSRYIYVQTDKPIYTPKQSVQFRIIPFDEETKPTNRRLRLQIRNPKNVVVRDTLHGDEQSQATRFFFTPEPFTISAHPLFGSWSATVLYGYKFQQNVAVSFEVVEEYVSPTFTVKLEVEEVILPSFRVIPITVRVRYLYGKPVTGIVTIRLGLRDKTSNVIFFGIVDSRELRNGEYTLDVKTVDLKRHRKVGWFPDIEGFHFIVEATVTDSVTGLKEVEVDSKGIFTSFPFVISFKRCLSDFKPGFSSVIEADLTYMNGRPAADVKTVLTGMANRNLPLRVYNNVSISNDEGHIWFEIHPEVHHAVIDVEVKVEDSNFGDMEMIGRHQQKKFSSRSGAYISINRSSRGVIQPGSSFSEAIYIENSGPPMTDIYFLVAARGKILLMEKLTSGQFRYPKVEFNVTYKMAPSFRVTVFGHCNGELIADSRRVDVANKCDPEAIVSVEPQFKVQRPGTYVKITLRGTEGTMVGLFGVDAGMYALPDQSLLTKSKLFKALASRDLGSGPGGGWIIDEVLGNAGLVILSNLHSQSQPSGIAPTLIGQKSDNADMINQEEEEENTADLKRNLNRSNLLWFDYYRPEGHSIYETSLPHSITTWTIQAVSVSPNNGMCVTEPKELQVMAPVFVQLHLPNFIVRNEQVEIKATVFNYGIDILSAIIYMSGARDLCSGMLEGKKSERKRIIIEAQSAQSVYFPVMPLKTGKYDIKVYAFSPGGSDIEIRELNVVPEGHPVENHITIALDPSNQQKRKGRKVVTTKEYTDTIDDVQQLQVTVIRLNIPEDSVPGTESCVISALGDQFGPTVETSVENPESLLSGPSGCAEQNMIYFAPTIYTMRYLKFTGKISAEKEEKGYNLMWKGYAHQLTFRKTDGSFGAWITTPSSVWLTAFVTRVFCEASELIFIDPDTMCTGVSWLMSKQNLEDGSFEEDDPVYHKDLMGGVNGTAPLTAYVLLTLETCKCNINTTVSKARALDYLEGILETVIDPLPTAIVAYTLSFSNSNQTYRANEKLFEHGKYDATSNTLHWGGQTSSASIEATSYALLTQLQLNDMEKSNSIVNWLNTQRYSSGRFQSTQDTVVALSALSEYAIKAKLPDVDLISNLTITNNRYFHKTLVFDENNARVLQKVKVDKLGGNLIIHTTGQGTGFLSVKLRYNLPTPPEELCKFEITVNVSAVDEKGPLNVYIPLDPWDLDDDLFPEGLIRTKKDLADKARIISKREDKENNAIVLNIKICVRYLGDREAEMTIVDAGIFSGFNPVENDLKKLMKSRNSLIDRYEVINKGVIFYLRKVPRAEPYCFAFRIMRNFIVGNLQSRVIRVYDYYNPEESCTLFYRPDTTSSMLHKICSNGICQCAEEGCPPKNPFRYIDRNELLLMACESHNYVWKGKIISTVQKGDGFLRIKFQIQEVLQEGIETTLMVEGQTRTLLSNIICESAELISDQEYLIMGRDGEKYENENGEMQYRYMLDKSSKIQMWISMGKGKGQAQAWKIQRNLDWLSRELKAKGCYF